MVFADARVCPSCRGGIEQATTCPHCGLNLTSHEIQQAWRALVVADQWVERARAMQTSGAAPTAVVQPHPPTSSSVPRPRRTLSAGAVLLGLGAIAIVVAGIIFVSVSWGALGVLGRALVLLVVTVLFGAAARFVTRRGLRASSEALWSVFLALLTLDWFAARAQGLAGLDAWPMGVSATTWMVLVVCAVLLVVPLGRRHLSVTLVAPSIAAGAAPWFAGGSLAADLTDAMSGTQGDADFWPAALATIVVGAVTLVLARAAIRIGRWIGVAGVIFYGLFAVGFAVAEAIDHPSWRDLTVDAHGLPLLVVVLVAGLCGLLIERTRVIAASVALAGGGTLAAAPVEHGWPERGAFVLVAALVAGVSWVAAGAGSWRRGFRLTTGLATAALALAATPWVGRLLTMMAEGGGSSRVDDLSAVLRPQDAPDPGPWWVALVVAGGIVGALAGMRRWSEAAELREHVLPAAWCTGVIGAWSALAAVDLTALGLGAALLVGGALLGIVLPHEHPAWRWVGPASAAVAPLVTLTSWPATVIVWPSAALVLAVVAVRGQGRMLRAGAAFLATGWGLGTAGPALELINGDDRWTALALVVAGLAGLAFALVTRPALSRLAVQAAAATLGATGLAMGSSVSTVAFASFTWTVAGAGVVLIGLVPPRDAWTRWIGVGLLGVAYVLRLVASDVEIVEAYTLPFAVMLLAAGLWAMRNDGDLRTVRALLAGMTLVFLPSLPQALDEPTSARALLLGVASVAALALGSWRRWQVPFAVGAIVLVLLVLANVGPLTLALPRWVLIAAVGAVLLAVGITWDDRVRDGRSVVRYVGAMR